MRMFNKLLEKIFNSLYSKNMNTMKTPELTGMNFLEDASPRKSTCLYDENRCWGYYKSNTTVFGAVGIIAGLCADRIKIKKHPMVIRNIAKFITIFGYCYIDENYKVYNPATSNVLSRNSNYYIDHNKVVRIDDGVNGVSPISAAFNILELHECIKHCLLNRFKSNGHLPGVLSHDEYLSKEDQQDAQRKMSEPGLSMFTLPMGTKWTPISNSLNDMSPDKYLKYCNNSILRAMGMPPVVVSEKSTRANFQASMYFLVRYKIYLLVELIIEQLLLVFPDMDYSRHDISTTSKEYEVN